MSSGTQLVLAIVQEKDAPKLIEQLTASGFQATMLASTGGFLRAGNATVLVGTEAEQVERVLEIVRATCRTREQLLTPVPPVMEPVEVYAAYPVRVRVGGAIVFVLDVVRMERV
ncbi:MAG: cyclic-di-AMP receptor [Armatimonadota bacterium]|nr:cyclic-di-AMP receptor [Armatimonadota bacterium]MDR7439274.1 cyclic-di-AMP receptor [Armatimonadota bacterium]MDR7562051.1 cyclic-di-AMP receptor [Armatimonadota bacterium]MDR7567279.1 cyclic-di-AMP receptor [Armatimonadota bacterium]MDR7601122.1 cyclic-di-AMP receptor [Armatimonadota bacterium]